MKKLTVFLLALLVAGSTFAQSEKYLNAMQPRVSALDTARDVTTLRDLAAAFERIAEAEKTQWHPYYYAALAQTNSGYFMANGKMGGMSAQLDPVADKAEALLVKAEALSPNNAELFVLRKMIATLRMMAEPMSRYMTYGKAASDALEAARKLNPDNPRVYLLEGQDKFYTPEQYGGSKTEAARLFRVALQKYDTFKPEGPLAPVWGRRTTEYFLGQAGK